MSEVKVTADPTDVIYVVTSQGLMYLGFSSEGPRHLHHTMKLLEVQQVVGKNIGVGHIPTPLPLKSGPSEIKFEGAISVEIVTPAEYESFTTRFAFSKAGLIAPGAM